MKKLIISIILFASVCVYAQTDDKTTLKELNQKLVESYKNNKLDDALKFANQAVELSLKIYGTDNVETAVAYSNLATIQREKKKYKDSIANFQKAVEIYLKLKNLKGNGLIDSFQNLALSQALGGKNEDSITNSFKGLELIETKFGKESKESFLSTLNIANGFARSRKIEKADEYYLKSYSVVWRRFGKSPDQIQEISDYRTCLLVPQITGQKNIEDNFNNSVNKLFIEVFGEQTTIKNPDIINAGVVNGKAVSIPKPEYPQEARNQRLSGQVSVRVTIDEKGKVIEANAICGKGPLEIAAEEAAKNAKFSTTTLSGKPVKVIGIIVYNFVP